jgi:hypothetical protein
MLASPMRSLARIDCDDGEGPLLLTSIAGSARPLDARNVRACSSVTRR